MLRWSFIMALAGTVTVIVAIIALFSDLGGDATTLAFSIIYCGGFLPSLVGVALAVGSMGRKADRSPVSWIALIWNALLMALPILLTTAGVVLSEKGVVK